MNATGTGLFPALEVPHWMDRSLPPLTLVGNLPFNVSTPLLIRLLKHMETKENIFAYGRVPMLFTFQHEVDGNTNKLLSLRLLNCLNEQSSLLSRVLRLPNLRKSR